MPHNLHVEDGRTSMMYVGQVPWHGLGTKLDSPPTSAKAIKAAGLDWVVKKVPLYAIEGGAVTPVPQRFAVVPKHRWCKPGCPVYGVVGKDYTPLQNSDAFGFFDSIVGEGAAIYHTAGALGDGQRIWVLAKLPGEIRVVGDDVSEKYLLLANGHDGNTTVQMKFTPVRVVCQNTLSLALDLGPTVSVHHGRGFWPRMDGAKVALGIIQGGFARLEREFKAFASTRLNEQGLMQYLTAVFPDSKDARQERRTAADRNSVRERFEAAGNALPDVKGTLWAAFNGVTDYLDHRRDSGRTPEQRLRSIWFGRGAQIKTRAYRQALSLARVLANG